MKRIVIHVEDGLVQDVFTDIQDVEIRVVDTNPSIDAETYKENAVDDFATNGLSEMPEEIALSVEAYDSEAQDVPVKANNLIASHANMKDWDKATQVDLLTEFIDKCGITGQLALFLDDLVEKD